METKKIKGSTKADLKRKVMELTALGGKEEYTFEELDDDIKEKVRDGWRNNHLDYDWWDGVYEDTERVGEILGVKLDYKGRNTPAIWFNGFHHQGSGSSFEGSYSYAKGAVKAIKAYAPMDKELHRIARDLQDTQKKNFYGLRASIEPTNRETSIRVNVENIHHIYGDATEEAEEAITEAMNDFNHWLFQRLEDEYEYLMSDESIDESIISGEYLFEEDGTLL